MTVVAYALNYALGALVLVETDMGPFTLMLVRWVISAAILWGVVIVQRRPMSNGRAWGTMVSIGLLVQAVQLDARTGRCRWACTPGWWR